MKVIRGTLHMIHDAGLQLLFTGRLIKLLTIIGCLSRNLDLKIRGLYVNSAHPPIKTIAKATPPRKQKTPEP